MYLLKSGSKQDNRKNEKQNLKKDATTLGLEWLTQGRSRNSIPTETRVNLIVKVQKVISTV